MNIHTISPIVGVDEVDVVLLNVVIVFFPLAHAVFLRELVDIFVAAT